MKFERYACDSYLKKCCQEEYCREEGHLLFADEATLKDNTAKRKNLNNLESTFGQMFQMAKLKIIVREGKIMRYYLKGK